MRVDPAELRKFVHTVPATPPPIEPLLSAAEEARVIADHKRTDAVTWARRQRVRNLLHRQAPPTGADAELIALLAAARALPFDDPDDRLKARQRLIEIGRLKEPPPEVIELLRANRIEFGDAEAFADALQPPGRDIIRPFSESPGVRHQ